MGRGVYGDDALEWWVLGRMRAGIEGAGLWDGLGTDWMVLDAELLPWSAKAGELLNGMLNV